MFAKFSVVERNGDAEDARQCSTEGRLVYIRTGETVSGEEGHLFDAHTTHSVINLLPWGEVWGHCGIVECVGELHDRKALYWPPL